MNRPDINSLEVDVHKSDDTHTEFTLTVAIYHAIENDTCHLYNDVTDADLWRAATQGAGFAARIGMIAVPFVAYEAKQHRCQSKYSVSDPSTPDGSPTVDGCNVYANPTLLRPSIDYGAPPSVCINVPNNRVTHWRGLINGWLKDLADEQAWGWDQAGAPATNIRAMPTLRRTAL